MDQTYKAHLFICTNKKEGKECCADKNAGVLREELKGWAKVKFGNKVRINNSGCLDRCSEGITAVLYPQNKWFTHLTTDSVAELKAVIEEAMSESLSNSR